MFFGIFSIVAGIIAVVMGILGMRECIRKPGVAGKGMGVAGLVMEIIALLGGVANLVFFVIFMEDFLEWMVFVVPF